jgi:hypothetical protein
VHFLFLVVSCLCLGIVREGTAAQFPTAGREFLRANCYDCHDDTSEEGGLNLETLPLALEDRSNLERWEKVHDRIRAGEMPPKKKKRPPQEDVQEFLGDLSRRLVEADQQRIAVNGRARVRRLNRFEFENSLRDALAAPWLQVSDLLPEDGTAHLFNKVGDRLDISHVQIAKYLEASEHALRMILQTVTHPKKTEKFYAREEPVMLNYLKYRFGQTAATRAAIPLLGYDPEPDVIRGKQPLTVGDADPERREREAMGFVSGTYTATTKYDFTRMKIEVDGRYRLRMKTYTFLAGPNGANGGEDHGLTGGNVAWWRPSRTVAYRGTRSEPVTIYALAESGDSRWLSTFDSHPDPTVIEREVYLKAGEKIRPDAGRLVRTRPGWKGNPNATTNGVPGFAMNWLEIEGPLHEEWPPACYKRVFGDLPFELGASNRVRVVSQDEGKDARRLLRALSARMWRQTTVDEEQVEPHYRVYARAREMGESFTDALIAAFSSVLCSSEFLFLEMKPGRLNDDALAARLSLFLWNGPPDETLLNEKNLGETAVLRAQTERMLEDPRAERFVNAFLDYWLDLRELNANTPDAELYPEYYLDDLLTESSLLETRRFFGELVKKDLPTRHLVDSRLGFVNERLAQHYGFPMFEGVGLRAMTIPEDSPRGGLLTHASVLRVTANGTTTSPVVRGAWIMERILGVHIPPPPSGVEAITPDTRGATTIREQLEKHRAAASCASCHAKFDPVGFAMESFDVAGGWRDKYRGIGEIGERMAGFGKNGHEFRFRLAQEVDCTGELADGRKFTNIRELKKMLLEDERAVARNLVERFVVYSTGAPITFSDRAVVESILDGCAQREYGVRSLIHGVVQSELFRIK